MHENICPNCCSYMTTHKLDGWIKCPSCSLMKKIKNSMITMTEILQGRAEFHDLPSEIQKNGEVLVERLNKFRKEFGIPMYVSSGYRTLEINSKSNGAKKSAHLTLEACDFRDSDGKLFTFIKNDPLILERCDLYMEDPRWTPTWIHLQIRRPNSGNRIFLPYSDGRPELDSNRKI